MEPPRPQDHDMNETARVQLFSRLAEAASTARDVSALIERFVDALADQFRGPETKAIWLYRSSELIPAASKGRPATHFSYEVAMKVIRDRRSIIWNSETAGALDLSSTSIHEDSTAIYAPVLFRNEPLGLIHLGSGNTARGFTPADLSLVEVVSQILSVALKARDSSETLTFPTVFISYSHLDIEFVKRLAKRLRKEQVQVYFDEKLEVGRDWKRQLAAAIGYADYFVCLLTNDSISSEMVDREVLVAEARNKRLVPVMYSDCEIPAWAAPLHVLRFDGDIEVLCRTLRDTVQQDWTEEDQ